MTALTSKQAVEAIITRANRASERMQTVKRFTLLVEVIHQEIAIHTFGLNAGELEEVKTDLAAAKQYVQDAILRLQEGTHG